MKKLLFILTMFGLHNLAFADPVTYEVSVQLDSIEQLNSTEYALEATLAFEEKYGRYANILAGDKMVVTAYFPRINAGGGNIMPYGADESDTARMNMATTSVKVKTIFNPTPQGLVDGFLTIGYEFNHTVLVAGRELCSMLAGSDQGALHCIYVYEALWHVDVNNDGIIGYPPTGDTAAAAERLLNDLGLSTNGQAHGSATYYSQTCTGSLSGGTYTLTCKRQPVTIRW